jgi:hypothetical protein
MLPSVPSRPITSSPLVENLSFFSLSLHLLRGAVLLVDEDRKNIVVLVRLDIGKEGLILAILLTPQFQRKWQQQQDQQNEKGFYVSHICTSNFRDFSRPNRHGGAVNDTVSGHARLKGHSGGSDPAQAVDIDEGEPRRSGSESARDGREIRHLRLFSVP